MKISTHHFIIIIKIMVGTAALLFIGAISFLIYLMLEKKSAGNTEASVPLLYQSQLADTTNAGNTANWREGDVRYQGVHYRYNEDIITILFLGIDKMEEVKPVESGIDGGQSDAIFLLVLNPHNKEISVISINRNTMAEVDVYDRSGRYINTIKTQITLQHAYGDGAELSCERTVASVSKFLYNLPINNYCSINMGAIPLINDAVGGVEIVAIEDVPGSNIKQGQTILLKGMDAYYYLHNRDTKSFASADRRLERQKQYLAAYAKVAVKALKKDLTLPVTLYNTLSKYMVTDISVTEAAYLATQALGYQFSEDGMYSLSGETVEGTKYEEFYPDETALYEMLLEIFYEEVN